MSKVYFIAEVNYGEEHLTSQKLYSIGDYDGSTLYEDFFNITECKDFDNAKNKDEFVATVVQMAQEYFADNGEFDKVLFTAIDKDTHVFQWGVEISIADNDNLQYASVDWKKDGNIFKYSGECDEES